MNKRRRTSSVASRGTEDDADDIPPEPTKRRKKLDPVSYCCYYKILLIKNFNINLINQQIYFI